MKTKPLQTIGLRVGCLRISCLGLIALLLGCDKPDAIRTYNAPKDPPAIDAMQAAAPSGAQETKQIRYTVPDGWEERFGSGMVYSSFAIKTTPPLTVTVIPLGNGDVVSNINRWRDQLGLPAAAPADIDKEFPPFKIDGRDSRLVDISGPNPAADGKPQQRMLAAIVPGPAQTWFVKVMGNADVVAANKTKFDGLVKSIRFGGPAAIAAVAPDAKPPADKPATEKPPVDKPAADDKPATEKPAKPDDAKKNEPITIAGFAPISLPDGWTLDPNPRQMRLATIHIGAGNEKAELAVSRLNANSLADRLANVNRWRGQVKLPPTANAADHPAVEVPNPQGAMAIVDIAGAQADGGDRKRLLVGMSGVQKDGQIVFFRLLGPHDLVAKNKPAMEAFLKSLKLQE